ncbi:TolC family protein [Shewanella sp. ENK2]|uniref:TolC family protein n=1 Tax=Shewanella sp. ENK2 TaxID=2775245 RepID=UPI003747CD58
MMNKSIISSALIVHLSMMGASIASIQTVHAEGALASTFNRPMHNTAHSALERTNVTTSTQSWFDTLMLSFEQLPQIQAQMSLKRQALLKLSAADNAIYNPELGVDYQHAPEDDTFTIVLSQTIDWSDKRGAAIRLAQLESEITLSEVAVERSQILSKQLLAIVALQQNQTLFAFNQQQFDLARAQLALAEQRVEVGDIAMVELQLMRLDVANNAAALALAEQALLVAETEVYTLLGHESVPNITLNSLIELTLSQRVTPELPALKTAYQQVMLAKLQVNQLKADLSADPSISLSAEREGSDNKWGLGVSIPLTVRNNYHNSFAAANESIAIAEQSYLATEKALHQQWQLFTRAIPRLLTRYQDWQQLVEQSGQEATALISGQWQTGDISTSDYLQSQRQMSTSFVAGVNLEANLYQHWLTWMGDSGQLEQVLQQHFMTSKSATTDALAD